MTQGLDFSNDEGFVPNSWEALDESSIKNEITGLISRISNVASLLDKMVYRNDYDNTEKAYSRLYMEDLGVSGFVTAFYNTNSSAFSKFMDENSAPPWYHTLKPEEKKSFDASQHIYYDASLLVKPMAAIRWVMMVLPLRNAFKFMRTTLNFDEAGYNSDLYHRINDELKEVSGLINRSWESMERDALASAKYFEQNRGTKTREQMLGDYRQARLRDYQSELQVARLGRSFIQHSDGTYSVSPDIHVDMKVIDKYTLQISSIDNIEDDIKKVMDEIPKVSEMLNNAWKECRTAEFRSLIDALDQLKKVIYEFCEGGLNVWTCYKNRDTDAPYCFIRILPAFSTLREKYGLVALNADPWSEGTQFYKLYELEARALSEHCKEFVYRHGLL